jgi:ParB-like chromosome segregation protein Spo0J
MSFDFKPSAISAVIAAVSNQSSDSPGQETIYCPELVQTKSAEELCENFKDWLPDLRSVNGLAGMIDSSFLAPSRWSGRLDSSPHPDNEDTLETHVDALTSSFVPLFIRPWPIDVKRPAEFPHAKYEVLSGGRRLRAHLEREKNANTPLTDGPLLPVVVLLLDDQEAARLVVQSNRAHRPLRPFEWALLFQQFLTAKIFVSQKSMAKFFGVQESEVCRALKLARLVPVVLKLFKNPLEFQYVDGDSLEQAWTKNPAQLEERARKAFDDHGPLSREDALLILLAEDGQATTDKSQKSEISIPALIGVAFVVSTTANGVTSMKVKKKLSPQALKALCDSLEALASGIHAASFTPE